MEYYVFKLNLEPSILAAYNYSTQREDVVGVVIPRALKGIFNQFKIIDDEKIKFLDHVDIEEVKKASEYINMLDINKTMIKMYTEVVEAYKDGKGITYSPEYLDQRDRLNSSIDTLTGIHPFLKGAFDIKEDVFPVYAFSKIKMSLAYIKKAKQIEYYLNNFPRNVSNAEFTYDTNDELIYISAESKSIDEAKNYVELLEERINSFSHDTNIGRISINPIYEEIVLEGMYSEITIELVYPNGDPARDRSRAIEEANAAKEKTTFEASKQSKIDAAKLSQYYKKDAEEGYVRSVTSRGKSIIKSLIKIVRF